MSVQMENPAAGPIGLCLDCGYALWGLPEARCPECGRSFDPLDPATMNMGRELSPFAKWVLGPVRWPVSALTWAAIGMSLWAARLPGGQFGQSASIVILLTIGLLWLAWPIVRVMAAHRYGWPHELLMRGQRQRIAVGVAVLLAAALVLVDLPMRTALWISRPAMNRMATSMLDTHQQFQPDHWVGLYRATRISTVPGGGVRFTCDQQSRSYRSGFVYLPNVDPTRAGWSKRNYRYVGGGWWAWREDR